MRNLKKHIICARLLLLVFISGQLVLFTHQHEIAKCCGEISRAHFAKSGYHANKTFQTCFLCDVILHKKMLLNNFYSFKAYYTTTTLKILFIHSFQLIFAKEARSRAPPQTACHAELVSASL